MVKGAITAKVIKFIECGMEKRSGNLRGLDKGLDIRWGKII